MIPAKIRDLKINGIAWHDELILPMTSNYQITDRRKLGRTPENTCFLCKFR